MALIMVFFDKDNLSNGLCILFCTQTEKRSQWFALKSF